MNKVAFLVLMTAVSALYTQAARAGLVVANAGFEAPELSGGYQYHPTVAQQGGSGWTFEGSTGIAANGSGFGVYGAPQGDQVAFLQQDYGDSALASFSQSIGGFTDGSYQVAFYAAGRPGFGSNPFEVDIDGQALTFGGSPIVAPPDLSSTQGFAYYTSDPVALTAGSHTLSFTSAALVPFADVTSFIDAVSIAPAAVAAVPEPSTIVPAGVAAAAGLAYTRRRRGLAA